MHPFANASENLLTFAGNSPRTFREVFRRAATRERNKLIKNYPFGISGLARFRRQGRGYAKSKIASSHEVFPSFLSDTRSASLRRTSPRHRTKQRRRSTTAALRFGFYTIPQVLEHPVDASYAVVSQDFTNVLVLVLEQHPMSAKPKSATLRAIDSDDETLVLRQQSDAVLLTSRGLAGHSEHCLYVRTCGTARAKSHLSMKGTDISSLV